MSWFNYYGLAIVFVIMVPNIVYAVKNKNGIVGKYKNKAAEIAEQIGRFGCIAFMIFNIPYTYFNFWFENALLVYLTINSVLCLAYYIFWVICWDKNNLLKAVSLSVIPSVIFLFSGILLANFPLVVTAIIFGINHILISLKNAD